jgi:hypothetical protein
MLSEKWYYWASLIALLVPTFHAQEGPSKLNFVLILIDEMPWYGTPRAVSRNKELTVCNGVGDGYRQNYQKTLTFPLILIGAVS